MHGSYVAMQHILVLPALAVNEVLHIFMHLRSVPYLSVQQTCYMVPCHFQHYSLIVLHVFMLDDHCIVVLPVPC